jgi:hypothetical protein
MRTPLSPANRPKCRRSRSPASQTYSTQAAATITAVEPNVQATSTKGVWKKRFGSLSASSHTMSDAKTTRAAMPAVRRQSRPMPDTREIEAQRYAKASRAGTQLGTGCQTWTKSPLLRPIAPSQIMAAAKAACPALSTRIALPSLAGALNADATSLTRTT